MPRKKIFTMELPYSPLTCDQADEILKRTRPADDAPEKERDEFFRTWNLDVIRMGLNNAAGIDEETLPPDQWPWTNKLIPKKIDLIAYSALEYAILDMTGLVKREIGQEGAEPKDKSELQEVVDDSLSK